MVLNPITVGNFLFNCTPADRPQTLWRFQPYLNFLSNVGWCLMLCLWSGPPEFSFAPAFQLFHAVESSLLLYLCIRLTFMFSEMLHCWVRNPSRVLNHDRTKGEDYGHVKSILSAPTTSPSLHPHKISFTDRSKAVHLLWFIMVIVRLCMYVLLRSFYFG